MLHNLDDPNLRKIDYPLDRHHLDIRTVQTIVTYAVHWTAVHSFGSAYRNIGGPLQGPSFI